MRCPSLRLKDSQDQFDKVRSEAAIYKSRTGLFLRREGGQGSRGRGKVRESKR